MGVELLVACPDALVEFPESIFFGFELIEFPVHLFLEQRFIKGDQVLFSGREVQSDGFGAGFEDSLCYFGIQVQSVALL